MPERWDVQHGEQRLRVLMWGAVQRRGVRDHGDADVDAEWLTAGAADGGDDGVEAAEQGAAHGVDAASWSGAELGAWVCGDGGAGGSAVSCAAAACVGGAWQLAIIESGGIGVVGARSDAVAGASGGIVSSADTCG